MHTHLNILALHVRLMVNSINLTMKMLILPLRWWWIAFRWLKTFILSQRGSVSRWLSTRFTINKCNYFNQPSAIWLIKNIRCHTIHYRQFLLLASILWWNYAWLLILCRLHSNWWGFMRLPHQILVRWSPDKWAKGLFNVITCYINGRRSFHCLRNRW